MSRRRRATDQWLLKVGCTGRGSHKRLVFDTVALSVRTDTNGDEYIGVQHNVGHRGSDHNELQVPAENGPTHREVAGVATMRVPHAEFANYSYKCSTCGRDFPMRADRDAERFALAFAGGVSFLDLSALDAIL